MCVSNCVCARRARNREKEGKTHGGHPGEYFLPNQWSCEDVEPIQRPPHLLLAGLLWLDCHWKHSVEEHAPQKAHESALREAWEQVKGSPEDVRCVFITHQFNIAQESTEHSSGGCLLPGDPQSGVA